jgi:hypothetical protein
MKKTGPGLQHGQARGHLGFQLVNLSKNLCETQGFFETSQKNMFPQKLGDM